MEPLPDNALFLYVRISFVSDSPAPGYFGGYCLVCGDFDMGASGRFASKFFCLQTDALILLLPALLIFIFSVLPLRETVPLPAISQSKRVMAMESAFIVPPPANLISSFLPLRPLPKSQLPPPAILNSFSAVELLSR